MGNIRSVMNTLLANVVHRNTNVTISYCHFSVTMTYYGYIAVRIIPIVVQFCHIGVGKYRNPAVIFLTSLCDSNLAPWVVILVISVETFITK